MLNAITRRLRRHGGLQSEASVTRGREGASEDVDAAEADRQDAEVLPERNAMTLIDPSMFGHPPVPVFEQPLDEPVDSAS